MSDSVLASMTGRWLAQGGPTFWMPSQNSEHAREVDFVFYYITYIATFFFLLIVTLMVVFVIRYRRRSVNQESLPSPAHNTPLELLWTGVPIFLAGTMFILGFRALMNLSVTPLNAYEVQVTGMKWKWQFTYPTGYVDEDLHVPVNSAIGLVLTSTDVIHGFFVPNFRIKRDAVPGRYTKIWFRALTPGKYPIYCTQYCGTGHSTMRALLVVHEPGEFEQWLEKASNFVATMPPVEAGERLYQLRGCKQCHSIDGTAGTGPTFKNLFGHEVALQGGRTVEADENYIRESILEPQAKVAAGFEPVMPRIQVNDPEVNALIAYIKSLSDRAPATVASASASQPKESAPAP